MIDDISSSDALFAIIDHARIRKASDIHVEPGEGVALRIFTNIERLPNIAIRPEDVDAFLGSTFDKLSRSRLEKLGIADAVFDDARCGAIRIHASRGKRGVRLAIRLLARSIPELESLRLPAVVDTFAELRSGLVLICGPTGSGKSTTIASLLDRVNATSSRHIITFEDPIEYQHRWGRSIITQYEIGRDVANFPDGVRGALRADPDVLSIGELRGVDTVSACFQAAETGHVVFAALHTPSETPQAINRVIGLFASEEQDRARVRLAETLRAIVGLCLLPLKDGSGLRAAAEILIVTDAVRRLIRDGATHQLRSVIASARKEGSQTLEAHIAELVAEGDVDVTVGRAASSFAEEIRDPLLAYRRR